MNLAKQFLVDVGAKPRTNSDPLYLRRWVGYCTECGLEPRSTLSPEGLDAMRAWSIGRWGWSPGTAVEFLRRVRRLIAAPAGMAKVLPSRKRDHREIARPCVCGEAPVKRGSRMCEGCLSTYIAHRRAPKGSATWAVRRALNEVPASLLAAHLCVPVTSVWRVYVGRDEGALEMAEACARVVAFERSVRHLELVPRELSAYSGRGFTYPAAGGF